MTLTKKVLLTAGAVALSAVSLGAVMASGSGHACRDGCSKPAAECPVPHCPLCSKH